MTDSSTASDVRLVIRLGALLIRSGEAVDVTREHLLRVAEAIGLRDVDVVVLPTTLFVRAGSGEYGEQVFASVDGSGLRLDQISSVWALLGRVERSETGTGAALAELDAALTSPPPYGPLARTLGHGVLSAGFALMLQADTLGVLLAFLLGVGVGLVRLVAMPELDPVLPVLLSFGVAAITFAAADHLEGGSLLWLLIPPLVTMLPGAAITTGTMELAAGQTVSGSSRLVEGLVDLALLAAGIVTAAAVVGAPPNALLDQPPDTLGGWAPWLGLIVITAGHHLHLCAPRSTLPWILLLMVVAYGGQALGALLSAELSAFFGALAMTPLALAVGRRPQGPPSMVLFLPGFWLLVPGAAGLIGVTQYVGAGGGIDGLTGTLVTVLEIALGVLLGTALDRSVRRTRTARWSPPTPT